MKCLDCEITIHVEANKFCLRNSWWVNGVNFNMLLCTLLDQVHLFLVSYMFITVLAYCSIAFQLIWHNCKFILQTIISIISLLQLATWLPHYMCYLCVVFTFFLPIISCNSSLYVMQVPHVEVLERVSSILKEYGFCPTGDSMDTLNLYYSLYYFTQ